MVRLESDSVGVLAKAYVSGPFGLSFLMAWIYGTFYSSIVWSGSGSMFNAEYPWIVSMFVSGLLGVAGCLALGLRAPCIMRSRSWVPMIAATLCAAGVVLVSLCSRGEDVEPLAVVLCAIPVAVGFAILTIVWGSRISECDDAMIEFSVPMSFIVARIISAVLGLLHPEAALALLAVLPFASIAFLRPVVSEPEVESAAFGAPERVSLAGDRPLLRIRGIVAAAAVLFAFRVGYGIVRVLADGPAAQGIWYFLSALFVPVAVFGVFVVLALTSARSIGSALVTRWMLPVLLLAFALLPVDGDTGYRWTNVANSVASIILQAFFWILLAKEAHRRPGSGPFFFSCYLVGLGIGMAVGEGIGLVLLSVFDGLDIWFALPFVTCALVALVMALEGRARQFGTVSEPGAERAMPFSDGESGSGSSDIIDLALRDQARRMAQEYRLSPREEEIVAYLLAGRNRPYIRDTLLISLNTVNTHIKNAFAKLDIHSQQELLDIARAEFPARLR